MSPSVAALLSQPGPWTRGMLEQSGFIPSGEEGGRLGEGAAGPVCKSHYWVCQSPRYVRGLAAGYCASVLFNRPQTSPYATAPPALCPALRRQRPAAAGGPASLARAPAHWEPCGRAGLLPQGPHTRLCAGCCISRAARRAGALCCAGSWGACALAPCLLAASFPASDGMGASTAQPLCFFANGMLPVAPSRPPRNQSSALDLPPPARTLSSTEL